MAFELTELPYAADALKPYMSAETLEFHHGKHHATYVANANKLIAGSGLEGKSLQEVIVGAHGANVGLFNNAAQHFNHDFYWHCMKPAGGGNVPGALASRIDADLGGMAKFREDFLSAGATQFGSGWAWLVLRDGKLAIEKTPNAENPLVTGGKPLLVVDVWEHAYYIDYRNARPKFLEAWFDNLVNWDFALEKFEAAD